MADWKELSKRLLVAKTVGSFGLRSPAHEVAVSMSLVDAIQSLTDSEAEHGIISVGSLPDDFTSLQPAKEAFAAGALRVSDLVAWAIVELDLLYGSVQAHHGLPVDSREVKVALGKASKKSFRDTWKSAVASISGGPSPCKAAKEGTSPSPSCEECPASQGSTGSGTGGAAGKSVGELGEGSVGGAVAGKGGKKPPSAPKQIPKTLLWQLQELQHYVRVPLSAMAHSVKCLPVFPLADEDTMLHVLQLLGHVDGSVLLLPPNKGHSHSIITQEDMFQQLALLAQHDPWASYLEQLTLSKCSAAVVEPVRVRAACSLPEAVRSLWVCNAGEALVLEGDSDRSSFSSSSSSCSSSSSSCGDEGEDGGGGGHRAAAYDVIRLRDLEVLLELNCGPAVLRDLSVADFLLVVRSRGDGDAVPQHLTCGATSTMREVIVAMADSGGTAIVEAGGEATGLVSAASVVKWLWLEMLPDPRDTSF